MLAHFENGENCADRLSVHMKTSHFLLTDFENGRLENGRLENGALTGTSHFEKHRVNTRK